MRWRLVLSTRVVFRHFDLNHNFSSRSKNGLTLMTSNRQMALTTRSRLLLYPLEGCDKMEETQQTIRHQRRSYLHSHWSSREAGLIEESHWRGETIGYGMTALCDTGYTEDTFSP